MIAIGFDTETLVVVLVLVLLFGGSQIPKLARNLGRAQKEFKDGIDEAQRETPADVTESSATTENTPK